MVARLKLILDPCVEKKTFFVLVYITTAPASLRLVGNDGHSFQVSENGSKHSNELIVICAR